MAPVHSTACGRFASGRVWSDGADQGPPGLCCDLQVKKGYVGIHSSGFKDFLLKPELLRAIQDCGFEHPSEGERGAAAGGKQEGWRCGRSDGKRAAAGRRLSAAGQQQQQ